MRRGPAQPVSFPSSPARRSRVTCLLEEVRRQHQDFCVRPEALSGAEISNALLVVLWRGHDLEDVERGPGHVVADHLEVDQFEERRRLEICENPSVIPTLREPTQVWCVEGSSVPMSEPRISARHSLRQFWMYSRSFPLWFLNPRMRSYSDFSNLRPRSASCKGAHALPRRVRTSSRGVTPRGALWSASLPGGFVGLLVQRSVSREILRSMVRRGRGCWRGGAAVDGRASWRIGGGVAAEGAWIGMMRCGFTSSEDYQCSIMSVSLAVQCYYSIRTMVCIELRYTTGAQATGGRGKRSV